MCLQCLLMSNGICCISCTKYLHSYAYSQPFSDLAYSSTVAVCSFYLCTLGYGMCFASVHCHCKCYWYSMVHHNLVLYCEVLNCMNG